MVSFNKVFLIGNLTRDPELRYTPNGVAVATLRIAVNTQFRDRSGERKVDTCYVNVVVWSRQAELCCQYLSKGRRILVEGRLQSRSWETNEGNRRSVIEIRADRVQFLDGVRNQGTSSQDVISDVDIQDVSFEEDFVSSMELEDVGPTDDRDLPF